VPKLLAELPAQPGGPSGNHGYFVLIVAAHTLPHVFAKKKKMGSLIISCPEGRQQQNIPALSVGYHQSQQVEKRRKFKPFKKGAKH
jgi:hypothetical protein